MKAVGKFYNLYGFEEEFFIIPQYSKYLISKTGCIITANDHIPQYPFINKSGYAFFIIITNTDTKYFGGRHRLLLQTFKPRDGFESLYANHINGIKGDDRLDNLEWVTPKENVEHAGLTGLSKKCLPIQVRIESSGVVTTFPSIKECSRQFGISKDIISYRTRSNGYRIYPDGKRYRLLSDRPWPEKQNCSTKFGRCNVIDIRNLETGDITTVMSQREAARFLGSSDAHVSKWLRDPRQPVLTGLIQIKYSDEVWIDHVDPFASLEEVTRRRVVVVKDFETCIEKWYESAVECAKDNNIKPTALNYRLSTNGKVIFPDGKTYRYHKPSSPLRVTEE